ncbi:MAG: glycosyltransferase family 2 protein [Agathobacter sp.]
MEQKLVSIVTPMYQAKRYIRQTIESVQSQTYPDWEMIIVDDCSTDGCAEIVKQMAKKDARIRYICQPNNMGVAQARNTAMEHAKGRYLAFLDSDDLWTGEKLAKQMALMQKENAAFVFAGCEVIDENGNRMHKIRQVPEKITYEKLLWGNVIPCLTVLVDREKTGDFRMPRMGHEDYAAWLTIFKKIKIGYGINEVLGYYRVNRNSVSGRKLRTIRWTWNIYRKNQGLPVVKSFFYLLGHLTQAMRKMR